MKLENSKLLNEKDNLLNEVLKGNDFINSYITLTKFKIQSTVQNSNEEKRLLHEQIKILKQKLINVGSNGSSMNNKNEVENNRIMLQNEIYNQEINELKKANNHLKSENDKMSKQIKLFEKQEV